MPDESERSTPSRNLSVLVVEDQFLIAMLLESVLQQHGHSVIGPSCSVEAALRVLETEHPDVAILDVNLRGRLVTPVAERLQSLAIPFLVSSAYSPFDCPGGPILRDAEHLGKPVDGDHLLAALDRATR